MPVSKLANQAHPLTFIHPSSFPPGNASPRRMTRLSYIFMTDSSIQLSVESHPVSNNSQGERRNDKAERKKICMTTREIFPTELSIKLIYNLMRTLEQFNIELRKWQASVLLMRQPDSGNFLQCVCCFYSISTLQPFCCPFLSQISCMCIYMCVCARMRVWLRVSLNWVCKLGYFNIPFSWTVQTMNSYDRVSISRLNYVERTKKAMYFFQVFTSDQKF